MKGFLPAIFSLSSLALVVWFVVQPELLVWSFSGLAVFSLLTAWLIAKRKDWWNFALLPILTNLISLAYLAIIGNSTVLYILIFVLTVINFFYYRFVFLYSINSPRYTPFSLENLSFYVNFILVFFLGSTAYGLRAFLGLNPFWLTLSVILVLALIIYQGFWVSKFSWQKSWPFWTISWLIMIQMFAVLMMLPLDYDVLGFIWATNYYLLISLSHDRLNDRFNRSKVKFYIILVAIIWLLLLVSARWI